MKQPKRAPQRSCVACGAKRDQGQLIRVALGPDAVLSIAGAGRSSGRGAYLCPARPCWEKALKGTRLEHSLRTRLTNENRAALLQYSSTLEDVDQ